MRSAETALCRSETAVVMDSRMAPVPLLELADTAREAGCRGGVLASDGRRVVRGGELGAETRRG